MKPTFRTVIPSVVFLFALSSCGTDGASSGRSVEAGADDDVAAQDDDVAAQDDDVAAQDDDITEPRDSGTEPTDGGPEIPDLHAIPDASDSEYQCAVLASRCHPFDHGTGDLGTQCHHIGHEGNVDQCSAMFDECVAFCTPDGGVEPIDAPGPLCEALASGCHELADGPDAGMAVECHETGHAGDETACAEIYDDCAALCGIEAKPSMCSQLADGCHELADAPDAGMALECHETGHDGDENACAEIFNECADLCGIEHEAVGPACEALASGCDELADAPDASGMAVECHETGHAGDEDACTAIYDDCADTCGLAPLQPSKCAELGERCHEFDTGPDAGLAHECHETGHAGDEEACGAIYDECVQLCAAPPDAG
jgi:hypothetical protein